MIYFFIEQSRNLSKLAEEKGIDYQDIYISSMLKLQEKYSLPSLHEWGDGYEKGDATLQELISLKDNINSINENENIYLEIEDDEIIETNLFTFLDKELISLIESDIDSQLVEFGENQYTKNQFVDYKEKLEEIIKDFLFENYYDFGGSPIGHDYRVYVLAKSMEVFEMVQPSSNWMFQNENQERFKVCGLNNYDKAFEDYTDLIAENSYTVTRDNLGITDETQIVEYLQNNTGYENNDDSLSFIIDAYKSMDFEQKLELWKEVASEGIKEYDSFMRSETIYSILANIDWQEIEEYFNSQFEN